MTATYPHCRDRELAHREADGIEVVLFWNADANCVRICVSDDRAGARFAFEPDPRHALDAFYHPYAYAPLPGVQHEGEFSRAAPRVSRASH